MVLRNASECAMRNNRRYTSLLQLKSDPRHYERYRFMEASTRTFWEKGRFRMVWQRTLSQTLHVALPLCIADATHRQISENTRKNVHRRAAPWIRHTDGHAYLCLYRRALVRVVLGLTPQVRRPVGEPRRGHRTLIASGPVQAQPISHVCQGWVVPVLV